MKRGYGNEAARSPQPDHRDDRAAIAGGPTICEVARVGFLSTNLSADGGRTDAFRQRLRELGYVEGHNLVIEYRDAEGKPERFPVLAAELAGLKPDVMVTAGGTAAVQAAKKTTATLPIVFVGVGDPVQEGLVA